MEAAVRIAPATRVGAVHLTVADLDRSIAYYESAIGLRAQREDGRARVGERHPSLLRQVE
jgi:catechol-2,3-dioxygenase